MNNLMVIHGGGPTAVMNSSLFGVIDEAKKYSEIDNVLLAIGGTGGLMAGKILNADKLSEFQISTLASSPASAIGTSRDHLEPEDYDKIVEIIKKNDVKYLLMNGGNGTMDACANIAKRCTNSDLKVIGIPKTIDNDLAETDHAPGFGSAARFMAGNTAELISDIESLPIHICVVEALGRNVGWLTAASALAKDSTSSPDLLYFPEIAFDEDKFLTDVEKLIKSKGCGVVVASEGLSDKDKKPIVEPIFKVGRSTYFGDVSSHLSNLIIKKLGYKARSEKPGLFARASIGWQSEVDKNEAILVGRDAVRAAVVGMTNKMVAINRISTTPYKIATTLVDLDKVMLYEKQLPKEFINSTNNGVTEEFLTWCRPLIGSSLPKMINANQLYNLERTK